jgi:hypothetical protein
MQIRLTRTRLIILGVIVVGAVAWFAFDYFHVSDAERIAATIDELALVIEANDPERVQPFLAEDFDFDRMGPEEFREFHEFCLRWVKVTELHPYGKTVTVDPTDADRATARVETLLRLDFYNTEYRFDWELDLRRLGEEEWKVSAVRAYNPQRQEQISAATIRALLPH